MKITELLFHDHVVLGNLRLSFKGEQSYPAAETVVIAGINGCGKTLIINEIYSALGEVRLDRETRLDLYLEFTERDREIINKIVHPPLTNLIKGRLSVGCNNLRSWDNINIELIDEQNRSKIVAAPELLTGDKVRPFRVFYSEASVGFISSDVQNIGASDVDTPNSYARKSGSDLGQQITNLLVDIRAQDNEDQITWQEEHPTEVVPDHLRNRRMKRFISAIEFMFPEKRFQRIRNQNGKYEILFQEGSKISTLNQLSTGEKQIIFRGGFLLRDLANLEGGIVLVDEPELSLHPDWQTRILPFYRSFLTANTQLIIATHSPFIVHNQIENTRVIILKKDAGVIAEAQRPTYTISDSARVVEALNVPALISLTEKDLILLVEGDSDKQIIEQAWSKTSSKKNQYFEVRATLSAKATRTVLNERTIFIKNPTKKIVGLFDFDHVYVEWKGVWNKNGILMIEDEQKCLLKKHPMFKGWSMLLPVPASRNYLASKSLGSSSVMSIEFLFEDQFHLSNMIERVALPCAGAFAPKMKDSRKTEFAQHVKDLPPDAFFHFKEIFARLAEI